MNKRDCKNCKHHKISKDGITMCELWKCDFQPSKDFRTVVIERKDYLLYKDDPTYEERVEYEALERLLNGAE